MPDKEFKIEDINNVVGGLVTSRRPAGIPKNAMSDLQNMYYDGDELLSDTGYTTFQEAVRGIPRRVYEFDKTTGSNELILITNDTIYTQASDEWQYIADATNVTTTDAAHSATDVIINVADTAVFSVNDYVGVMQDNGTQHKAQIDSISVGVSITIDVGLASDSASGLAVVKAVDLGGDDDDQVDIVTFSAFNYMIFTNGQDVVKYYNGTAVQNVPNLPSAGNTICKALAILENHLLLIHTIEGGTAIPQRVRWSDVADITNWTTGVSGSNDLFDDDSFCVAGLKLGPYLIVYKGNSIVRVEFIGASDKEFNFETVVTNQGIASLRSVVDTGLDHIFVGINGIYKYQGGFDAVPISTSIHSKIFTKSSEVNPNYKHRTLGFYVQDVNDVWFLFADVDGDYPNFAIRYNLLTEVWTVRKFLIRITGIGTSITTSAISWAELVGSWLAQTFKWGASALQANSPIIMLCSDVTTKHVYRYNYLVGTDDGTTIPWTIDTKEFYFPGGEIRTDWLEIRAKGGNIEVEYTIDGSNTWHSWKSATLTAKYNTQRYTKQVVSDRIRFRIKGSSVGFGLVWYNIRYRFESIQ